MKRKLLSLVLLLVATLTCAQSDGSIDSSFGTNGKVTTDIYGFADEVNGLAIQNDGKILAAGFCRTSVDNQDFCLVRYNQDGSLDTSFGTNGISSLDIRGGNTKDDVAVAVLIQSDGKIVLAGYTDANSSTLPYYFALVRLNTDGSKDTSYATDGILSFSFGDEAKAYKAIIQDNDKVIIVGELDGNSSEKQKFAVARIDATGNLDTEFSVDGKQVINVGDSYDKALAVALGADNKVFVGGRGNNVMSIAKLTTSGDLDASFNTNGIVTTDVDGTEDGVKAILPLQNNKVLGVGVTYISGNDRDVVLIKYNADGSVDTTFGTDGVIYTDIDNGSEDIVQSAILQSDGKFLISGAMYSNGTSYSFILRYNSDGSLDTDFSNDGKVIITYGSGFHATNSILLQDDGKILIGGKFGEEHTNTSNFALARMYNHVLSISKFDSNLFSLSPNPVISRMNIQSKLPIINYDIFDVKGRKVYSKKVTQNSIKKMELDLESLKTGLYMIKLKSASSYSVVKFLKE